MTMETSDNGEIIIYHLDEITRLEGLRDWLEE